MINKAKNVTVKAFVPCIILAGVALVLYSVRLVIGIMSRNGISLWIFGLSTEEITPALGAVSGILVVLFFAVVMFKKYSKGKNFIVIVAVVLSMLIMGEAVAEYATQHEYRYFEVVSDDGKHEIIIKEGSYLLSGEGAFYEKTSLITMVKVGEYSTDDGYRPFTHNCYEIEWHENSFEVTYSFNGSEITKKETAQYAK